MLEIAETPELTGHLIWALFTDPDLMDKSGQTWIGAELAREYGIEDETAVGLRRTATSMASIRSGSSRGS